MEVKVGALPLLITWTPSTVNDWIRVKLQKPIIIYDLNFSNGLSSVVISPDVGRDVPTTAKGVCYVFRYSPTLNRLLPNWLCMQQTNLDSIVGAGYKPIFNLSSKGIRVGSTLDITSNRLGTCTIVLSYVLAEK